MKKIIFATTNENKVREVRMMMDGLDVELCTMKEAGVDVDIVEDGTTFEENAIIKAKTIMEITGEIAIADDSGLEVDYLDGAPGIYSARFLGEDTSYDIKNNYIIEKLKDAKGKDIVNAWFAAFAPYDDPEIAVVIMVENGGHGNYTAEAVRNIMAEYFGMNTQDVTEDMQANAYTESMR